MLTQCPGCQTVFRVTSVILRAAHGQVRCGRCETQFDAIEYLLDGEEGTADQNTDQTTPVDTHSEAAAGLEHEDIVLEGNRIEISGVYQRVDAADPDEPATQARTVIEEFNIDTEEWENPFDDKQPQDADSDSDEIGSDETELDDVEQQLTEASIADAMATLDSTEISGKKAPMEALHAIRAPLKGQPVFAGSIADAPLQRPLTSPWSAPASAPFGEPFGEPASPRRWPWAVAALLLVCGLVVQIIHHSREALARHPSVGPQVTRLYAALGMPLAPQWELQAYSIKQWGIVADPNEPGTLRVRASVTNGASFAQPYPLLQLSLEDRFGAEVGSRAFTPAEYLGNAAQASRMLAAGEAANIDLAILDPGHDAVGFQFDTCLDLRGTTQCTHQQPL